MDLLDFNVRVGLSNIIGLNNSMKRKYEQIKAQEQSIHSEESCTPDKPSSSVSVQPCAQDENKTPQSTTSSKRTRKCEPMVPLADNPTTAADNLVDSTDNPLAELHSAMGYTLQRLATLTEDAVTVASLCTEVFKMAEAHQHSLGSQLASSASRYNATTCPLLMLVPRDPVQIASSQPIVSCICNSLPLDDLIRLRSVCKLLGRWSQFGMQKTEKLYISDGGITDMVITQLCPYWSCLTSLTFNISNLGSVALVSDNCLIVIAGHCPQLKALDITDCEALADDGVSAICKACHQLESLRLAGSGVTDVSLKVASEHCPKLTEIDVSNCYDVTDEGLDYLLELCPDLSKIACEWCDCVSGDAILKACKKHLFLTELRCAGLALDTTMIKSIAEATACVSLTSISLPADTNDACIVALARNCANLQNLEVSDSYVTDVGVVVLSERCTELKSLKLDGCTVTQASIRFLKEQHPGCDIDGAPPEDDEDDEDKDDDEIEQSSPLPVPSSPLGESGDEDKDEDEEKDEDDDKEEDEDEDEDADENEDEDEDEDGL